MTTTNEALKPCPFCGSTDLKKRRDDGLFWIRCDACGATGPENTKYAEEDEPQWNRRAEAPSVEAFEQIRFRFFKDLVEAERLKLLKVLGVLPADYAESMPHAWELKLLRLALAARPQVSATVASAPPDADAGGQPC